MNYKDFVTKFKSYELIVHKQVVKFVENMFEYLEYNFYHDEFKKIVYGKKFPETSQEVKIKNVYDAFVYLLNNKEQQLADSLLSRFYYLIFKKELDKDIVLKIQSRFYNFEEIKPIEKILDLHFYMYEIFNGETEEDQMIIAMLMLNYLLNKFNLITIVIHCNDYKKYLDIKQKYQNGDKVAACAYLLEVLSKEKLQPKSYYKNLRPINVYDISRVINENKDIITKMYQVTAISIFGSFAKQSNRIDSDIDLMIVFNENMSFEEKLEKITQIKEFLFYKLNRYIDIHEFNKYILEADIRGTKKFTKIL